MKKSVLISSCIAITALVVAAQAIAQTFTPPAFVPPTGTGTGNANWSVTLEPRSPGPNETVTAKAVSYFTNLNTADITWYMDGQAKLSGTGETNFTFTAPPSGRTMTVRVVIESADLGTLENTIEISPTEADLLWAANTYTPPFYRGKALPSSESLVTVVAIPHIHDGEGNPVSVSNTMFTWSKAYKTVPASSGAGKDVFVYKANFPHNDDNIGVSVSPRTGQTPRESIAKIRVVDPDIVFYENRALEGVRYEQAVGNEYRIAGNEVRLSAEPYHFSFNGKNVNAGKYDWRLDGKLISVSPARKSEATFGKPEGSTGRVRVELSISNPQTYVQEGKKGVLLSF